MRGGSQAANPLREPEHAVLRRHRHLVGAHAQHARVVPPRRHAHLQPARDLDDGVHGSTRAEHVKRYAKQRHVRERHRPQVLPDLERHVLAELHVAIRVDGLLQPLAVAGAEDVVERDERLVLVQGQHHLQRRGLHAMLSAHGSSERLEHVRLVAPVRLQSVGVDDAQAVVDRAPRVLQHAVGEAAASRARKAARRGEASRRRRHVATVVDQRALQILAVHLLRRGARREDAKRAVGRNQRLRRRLWLLPERVRLVADSVQARRDGILHRLQHAAHLVLSLDALRLVHLAGRPVQRAVGAEAKHAAQIARRGPRRVGCRLSGNEATHGMIVLGNVQQQVVVRRAGRGVALLDGAIQAARAVLLCRRHAVVRIGDAQRLHRRAVRTVGVAAHDVHQARRDKGPADALVADARIGKPSLPGAALVVAEEVEGDARRLVHH